MIFATLINFALFYLSAAFACYVTIVRTNKENTETYFAVQAANNRIFRAPEDTWESAWALMIDHVEGDFMVFEKTLESNPKLLIILDEALYSGRGPLKWIRIDAQSANEDLAEDAMAVFFALFDQMKDKKLLIGELRRLTIWNPPNLPEQPLSGHQGGIINLGATCYMNASLQALWNISVFHHFFQQNQAAHADNRLVATLNVIFESMERKVKATKEQIKEFIQVVQPYTIIPDMMEQNDPQEFIDGLLEGLAQAFRPTPLLPNSGIDGMFYMELEDVVSCSCGLHNQKRNPTTFIKADLQAGDPDLIELEALLSRFLRPDEIWDNPAHPTPSHYCTRVTTVQNLSPVVIIQINRKGGIEQDGNRFFYRKLNQRVFFPTDGLDITRDMTNYQGEPMIYDLVSIITHTGGIGGGHYTAVLRRGNGFVYANDGADVSDFNRAGGMQFAMEHAVELVYQLRGTIVNCVPVLYTIQQARERR